MKQLLLIISLLCFAHLTHADLRVVVVDMSKPMPWEGMSSKGTSYIDWLIEAQTNTFIYLREQQVIIQRADGVTFESYDNTIALYPRIKIPLNPGTFPGNWTDYEIKIFFVTNSVETWDDPKMVYYWQSMGDPWDGTGAYQLDYGDTDARVYYVDDHNAFPEDPRGMIRWSLYTNVVEGVNSPSSIADQLVSENSVVEYVYHYPSHEGCKVAWTNWMWQANTHRLRASFKRYDPLGGETNSVGVGRWQPVDIDWVPRRKEEAPLPQG